MPNRLRTRSGTAAAAALVTVWLLTAPAGPGAEPGETAPGGGTAEVLRRVDGLLLAYRTREAGEALAAVADRAPFDAGVAVRLGRVLAQSGDLQGAILQLRAAVLLAPAEPSARLALGEAYLGTRQVAEAMDEFRRARDLAAARADAAPREPGPLILLGASLQRLGDAAGSIRALERAVALDGANPEALYRLGTAELLGGKWADAVAALSGALAVDDAIAPAHFSRALAASRIGNGELVVDDMRRFLELAPDAPEAAQARAVVAAAAARATPPAAEPAPAGGEATAPPPA